MAETAVDNAKYRRLRANGVPHAQAVAMAAVTPTVDFSPPSSLATDLELSSALAVKAPLVSPAFTGTPTKNGSPVQSQADVAGAYVAMSKKAGQDTMRATRDRAFRTWDALLGDPAVATPRVHICGHSIPNGSGASVAAKSFTSLLASKMPSVRSGVAVTVDGHGGYTSTQLLANGVAANFVALVAGTYTADFFVRKASNEGKLSVYIDGVLQGAGDTIDLYSASPAQAKVTTTGFLVTTSGDHTITFTVTSKNASSSGYIGALSAMKWTKTA